MKQNLNSKEAKKLWNKGEDRLKYKDQHGN